MNDRSWLTQDSYTHYYEVLDWHSVEWQTAWPQLIQDVHLILEAADVLVQGPLDAGNELLSPVVDVKDGICFNGVANDRHEDFRLSELWDDFSVKTLQKPYDVAVSCVLIRAHVLAPNQIQIG